MGIIGFFRTPKDYDDHESFQDKLKKFQKIPPSTAPKPAGKPVAKGRFCLVGTY